jgi:hypothetical protein
MRRIGVIAIVLAAVSTGCRASSDYSLPGCKRLEDSTFALMAQAVPSATALPCITQLPVGWTFSGSSIRNGAAQMWLDSTIAGAHAVQVDLRAECDVGEAVKVPPAPDEVGMSAFVQPDLPPGFNGVRFLTFAGGCVAYRYRFAGDAPPTLALEAEDALSFVPRSEIVAVVQREFEQSLCGAGAPPCVG